MTSQLGPQCLKCRKRRVKCDSTTPTCNRCPRDGFECPGYVKKPAWSIKTVEDIRKRQEDRKKWTRMTLNSPPAGTTMPKSPLQIAKAFTKKCLKLTISPCLSTVDWDAWRVADSVMYYNTLLRPSMYALPASETSDFVDLEGWWNQPAALQYILIYGCIRHQVVCGHSTDPLQVTELHKYRGLSLTEVGKHLQNPNTKSTIVAFVSVMILLITEVQMSCTRLWHVHLDAAWQLIDQLEGLENLWFRGGDSQKWCTMLLFMDVISYTTTPSRLLGKQRTSGWYFLSNSFEGLQGRLLDNTCPCPLPIFYNIAEITDLRQVLSSSSKPTQPARSSPAARIIESARNPLHILSDLLAFDSAKWALEMCRDHETGLTDTERTGPGLIKWILACTALAKCYQSASIVYLIRSLQSDHICLDDLDCLDEFKLEAARQLPIHADSLSKNISMLLESMNANTPAGTSTNLWRFVIWPLFIDAYETIAWATSSSWLSQEPVTECIDERFVLHSVETYPRRDPEQTMTRLREIGHTLGANAFFDAITLLEGVQSSRQQARHWNWDDAFESRCVFVN